MRNWSSFDKERQFRWVVRILGYCRGIVREKSGSIAWRTYLQFSNGEARCLKVREERKVPMEKKHCQQDGSIELEHRIGDSYMEPMNIRSAAPVKKWYFRYSQYQGSVS